MHQIDRFPSVQGCASSARLVNGRQASGGKRLGPSGQNIGHARLTWACSAAATRFSRDNPQGQKLLRRLENTPGQGQALSLLAHQLGRAISSRRKRHTAFEMDLCRRSAGSRAGAPGAPRDSSGEGPAFSTPDVRFGCVLARPGVPRTRLPAPWRLSGPPLWRRHRRRLRAEGARVRPLPRT
jgi:hypothetical protein